MIFMKDEIEVQKSTQMRQSGFKKNKADFKNGKNDV